MESEAPRLPTQAFNNTLGRFYDDGHQKVSKTGRAGARYILDTQGMFYVHVPLMVDPEE